MSAAAIRFKLPGVQWTVRKTGNRLIATAPDLAKESRIDPQGIEWLKPQFIAGMRFYVSFGRPIRKGISILKNSNDN